MHLPRSFSLLVASLLLIIPLHFSLRVPAPLPLKKDPPASVPSAHYSKIRSYSGAGELAFVNAIEAWNGNHLQGWEAIGPMNSGGRIRGLAIDYRDSNILLCGGVSGGIFRSTDAGMSWSAVDSPAHIRLSSLAQDTRMGHGDRWYAATGEWQTRYTARDGSILGHGLYKSEDNGISWIQLPSTVDVMSLPFTEPFSFMHRVQVHPTTGDVYVAALGGIHRSQDRGQTWNLVLGDVPPEEVNTGLYDELALLTGSSEVHIAGDAMIYAAYTTYPPSEEDDNTLPVLKAFASSTGDQGGWTDITSPMFGSRISRTVIRSAPSDPSQVYFLCSFKSSPNGPSAYRIYGRDYYLYLYQRSLKGVANSSDSWQDLSENVPKNLGASLTQSSYNMEIAVHPENASEMYLGLVGFYLSDDGFRSPYIEEEHVVFLSHDLHPDQHLVVFDPTDSNIMYVANDGGIYKTQTPRFGGVLPGTDAAFDRPGGKNLFRAMNNGLGIAQIYDLCLVGGDYVIVGTQDRGAWVGRNSESDWFSYQGGDVFRASSSADGLFTVLTSSDSNPPEVLFNQDPSFNSHSNKGTRYLEKISRFLQHSFDPTRLYRMIGGRTGELIIYDDISAWMRNPEENPPRVSSLGVGLSVGPILATYPETRVYGLTFGSAGIWGRHRVVSSLLVATDLDSAAPPFRRRDPDSFPEALPSDLFVNRYDAREIIVSFYLFDSTVKILHSQDEGATWQNVTGNLASKSKAEPGPSVISLAIVGDGALFLAGTTSGLFATSVLSGNTTEWAREAVSKVNNHIVTDIEVDRFSRVTLATYGGGAFRVVYDLDPAPVYFTDIPQQVLIPIGTGTNTETVDLDLADYLEGSHRDLNISSHPGELVEISREGTILVFKGMEPGRGSVSVVAHAMEVNKGDVLSFPIIVYEREAAAQISTSSEVLSSRETPYIYIRFDVTIRNSGSRPFLILGHYTLPGIRLLGHNGRGSNLFPLEVAPSASEVLRYNYVSYLGGDADILSLWINLSLSEHPFLQEIEVDFTGFPDDVADDGTDDVVDDVADDGTDDVVDDGTVMMLGDAKTNSEFLFFPNPVGEQLTLVCSTETLVGLYNLGGQALQTFNVKGRLEVDTSFLPPGIYLLEERREQESPRLHRIIRR